MVKPLLSRSTSRFLHESVAFLEGQSGSCRPAQDRVASQASVWLTSNTGPSRLVRLRIRIPRRGGDRTTDAGPNRETHGPQAGRSVVQTPNLGIDRTPEQRRCACCSGAGHAGRWALAAQISVLKHRRAKQAIESFLLCGGTTCQRNKEESCEKYLLLSSHSRSSLCRTVPPYAPKWWSNPKPMTLETRPHIDGC
jgi:hypothetical protein